MKSIPQQKKIVFIVNTLKIGGAQKVFWLVSNELAKTENDVTLLVVNNASPMFTTHSNNLKVIDLKSSKASYALLKIFFALKQIGPDAVFVTNTHLNILVGLLSFFFKKIKFFARESNLTAEKKIFIKATNYKAKIVIGLINHIYPRFNKIICQTQNMKDGIIANNSKIKHENLLVIDNPIQPSTIINKKNKTELVKLVAIGRFTPEKGFQRLIEAINKLNDNYVLDIYGSGKEKHLLQDLINRLELNHRINLCGECTNVLNVIAEYDLLLLSSYTEGFPNVVLEALSVGTAVVAFNVGPLKKFIVDGENGFVVEQNDEMGFVEKIKIASTINWNNEKIKSDCLIQFSLEKIAVSYLQLS